MRPLLSKILAAIDAGQPLALCRLVATRGSTPQKPGAAMLVFPDGRQDGTLGGGCVEAEVQRQALDALTSEPSILRFQLDHDYGWDDGLICGGRMDVMVCPIRDARTRPYFAELLRLQAVGEGGVEAIRFESTTAVVPACWLFDRNQRMVRSLPDQPLDPSTANRLHAGIESLSTSAKPAVADGVVFLPIASRCRLLIVGAGHVGLAVANIAEALDFEIVVIDDREEFVSEERFPMATLRISGPLETALAGALIDRNTYCLIVTRGHNHDQEALFRLAGRDAGYLGMIGSRRKIRLIFENLLQEGVPPDLLRKVHAPVGIDIGSQSVPEIAVSIAAELIAHRNRDGSVPARPPSLMDDLR